MNLITFSGMAYAFYAHSQFMLLAVIAFCIYHLALRSEKKEGSPGGEAVHAVLRSKNGSERFEGYAILSPAFCEAVFFPDGKRIWDDPVRHDFILEAGQKKYWLRLIRRGDLDAVVPRLHLYWNSPLQEPLRPSASWKARIQKSLAALRT